MSLKQIRAFLGWCSVINFGLLFLIGIIYLLFSNRLYAVFNCFSSISIDAYDLYWLQILGIWKIAVWVFFIIPYFAAVLVDKKG
ncbi:MAG: DUF6868 family protein [Mangrovibacterium sp.]